MSELCGKCGAKCCKYFCFEIDKPDSFEQFDDIRWFLMHEGISVHIDEGDWYISIANRCQALGKDNRCGIYDERPAICRGYAVDNCDFTGGDYGYDEEFNTPAEMEAYARRKMGDKVYENARAKRYAKLERKQKKGQSSKRCVSSR